MQEVTGFPIALFSQEQEIQAVTGFPIALFSQNVIRFHPCTSQSQTLLSMQTYLLLYPRKSICHQLSFHSMSASCPETNVFKSNESTLQRNYGLCKVFRAIRRDVKKMYSSFVT